MPYQASTLPLESTCCCTMQACQAELMLEAGQQQPAWVLLLLVDALVSRQVNSILQYLRLPFHALAWHLIGCPPKVDPLVRSMFMDRRVVVESSWTYPLLSEPFWKSKSARPRNQTGQSVVPSSAEPHGCGSKTGTQNGTLVNGNND